MNKQFIVDSNFVKRQEWRVKKFGRGVEFFPYFFQLHELSGITGDEIELFSWLYWWSFSGAKKVKVSIKDCRRHFQCGKVTMWRWFKNLEAYGLITKKGRSTYEVNKEFLDSLLFWPDDSQGQAN